jgi:disulfide bond formation protein DsbB
VGEARQIPRTFFAQHALLTAWLVACAAFCFSLTFSEVRGWTPCALCWYQRICLWPLIPILGVALRRRRTDVVPYVLPQAIAGLLLAGYQVAIQDFVGRDVLRICRSGPDCAEKIGLGLGPVSIPMLSLAAFALIVMLLLSVRRNPDAPVKSP